MAFSAGFDADISVGGTDISQYASDVKFSPARKELDLPILGGLPVKVLVGPVKTMIDLKGWIDPAVTAVFTAELAASPPASVPIEYDPQGTAVGNPKRTCTAFLVSYDEDTDGEKAGEWTAKLAVDGAVTYASN